MGTVLAAIAVGLVGAWIAMALLAHVTVQMGPFHVRLDARFGRGETRVALPPFGSLAADTHLSPLTLSATLEDVGVEDLTDVVRERGVDGLVSDVERDAKARIVTLAWRVLVVAGIGGATLGLLVFRTRWHPVGGAVVAAVIGVAFCEVLMLTTFQVSALSEPTYSGSLGLAPDLIGPVRETSGRFDELRAGLQRVVDGAVTAYTNLQTTTSVGGDAIRVLHISDIHASPLGMDFAQEVASGFDVDMVIDTGDITSFATPIEDLMVSRIPAFGCPYLFVRGSHDSIAIQASIAREPNGVVLDGNARTIDGLRIYGLGHPAFTPARGVPVDDEEFAELARSAGPVIASDLDRLLDPVDLVAVHDDRMAEAVAGRVPLVISGHFHETTARVIDGTLFLRIGSTGGSGAGIFRGLDVPFSAEILYFSREEAPKLIAYDVIEQDPDSGSLTVKRTTISEEFGELVPTPTPSVTITPTPSLTFTTNPGGGTMPSGAASSP
jgi:predicted phosphodiesterase